MFFAQVLGYLAMVWATATLLSALEPGEGARPLNALVAVVWPMIPVIIVFAMVLWTLSQLLGYLTGDASQWLREVLIQKGYVEEEPSTNEKDKSE